MDEVRAFILLVFGLVLVSVYINKIIYAFLFKQNDIPFWKALIPIYGDYERFKLFSNVKLFLINTIALLIFIMSGIIEGEIFFYIFEGSFVIYFISHIFYLNDFRKAYEKDWIFIVLLLLFYKISLILVVLAKVPVSNKKSH